MQMSKPTTTLVTVLLSFIVRLALDPWWHRGQQQQQLYYLLGHGELK